MIELVDNACLWWNSLNLISIPPFLFALGGSQAIFFAQILPLFATSSSCTIQAGGGMSVGGWHISGDDTFHRVWWHIPWGVDFGPYLWHPGGGVKQRSCCLWNHWNSNTTSRLFKGSEVISWKKNIKTLWHSNQTGDDWSVTECPQKYISESLYAEVEEQYPNKINQPKLAGMTFLRGQHFFLLFPKCRVL